MAFERLLARIENRPQMAVRHPIGALAAPLAILAGAALVAVSAARRARRRVVPGRR